MTRRPMSARRAREIVKQARLVKAADWPDTRAWHAVSGGEVLVVVSPSYGGTSASGRNGWQWQIAGHGTRGSRPEPNREQAAAAGLAAWTRWATWKETT